MFWEFTAFKEKNPWMSTSSSYINVAFEAEGWWVKVRSQTENGLFWVCLSIRKVGYDHGSRDFTEMRGDRTCEVAHNKNLTMLCLISSPRVPLQLQPTGNSSKPHQSWATYTKWNCPFSWFQFVYCLTLYKVEEGGRRKETVLVYEDGTTSLFPLLCGCEQRWLQTVFLQN